MSAEKHEYGPVTEYHGTIDLPKVLSEGIRGGNPKTRSNRYIPEGMREEDLISYTHPDRDMALAYAQDRANRMKLDPKKVGVVGVRGTQLPEAVEHQEPKEGIFAGTSSLVRPGSISPEYLIQASEDKMKPKKKKGVVLIISVGPKMPRKPTDEATPNKEVKKAIPEEWDEQVDVNNNTSLRILPREFLSRASNPVPVPSARQVATDPTIRNEPGSTFRWEQELQEAHDKNPDYGYLPLPGFAEQDYRGQQISGTWVAPSDLRSFANPDFSFGYNRPSNYLLINDTPNFYRTQHENIKGGKYANEGFQYADEHGKAFDPEDFYTLPFPPDASVDDIKRVARNMRMGDTQSENAPTRFKEIEKLLERLNLSDAGGYQKWLENKRRPTNTQEAKDMGILSRRNDRIITGEPMDIAYQLLKDDDKNRTMEYAFDLGQPLLTYNELHDKQKQIVDAIADAPPSYWNDPASAEMETEYYARMFSPDTHRHYPDKAFDEYLRYIQHFHDASAKISELPHEKQMEIMSYRGSQHHLPYDERVSHPLDPNKVALDKMAEEHQHWGGDNPHSDFWQRYNEPQALMEEGGGFSQDFSETYKSKPMDIAFQLLKRELSPAARKHKLQYDTKYQSSPKRVKYRVELNRERRRRGIYGSGNGKDVSHTEGGKLTLENEHDNRARHFKNRGTLRKVKVKK